MGDKNTLNLKRAGALVRSTVKRSKYNTDIDRKIRSQAKGIIKNKARAYTEARKRGAGLIEASLNRELVHKLSRTGGPTNAAELRSLRGRIKKGEKSRSK